MSTVDPGALVTALRYNSRDATVLLTPCVPDHTEAHWRRDCMADTHSTEVWKSVAGWPKYEVSNRGRVRRFSDGYVLAQSKHIKGGYMIARLSSPAKSVRVHRLVAWAFIPNPDNHPEVNHLDGDTANNTVENLEWTTRQGNYQHAIETGLRPRPNVVFSEDSVAEVRRLYAAGATIRALSRQFDIHRTTVTKALRGGSWKHVSFPIETRRCPYCGHKP